MAYLDSKVTLERTARVNVGSSKGASPMATECLYWSRESRPAEADGTALRNALLYSHSAVRNSEGHSWI